jgi:uncharacterized protein
MIHWLKISFAVLGCLALVLYCAALGWLWFAQEKLIFMPTVLPANAVLSQRSDVREVVVNVPDVSGTSGAQLSALHLKLPAPKGVVFFLHGNAGNAVTWLIDPDFYSRANFDVVMMDYRGYGKSTGSISSEAQLRADVRAVWNHFAPQYPDKKWLLLGRSLGTSLAAGLAVDLAQAGRAPDATILVSPYENFITLTTEHYPLVPQALLRYPMRTDQLVPTIPNLLLLHGDQDTVIPLRHSQALAQLAPKARLQVIEGGAHNDLQDFASYTDAIQAVMRGL